MLPPHGKSSASDGRYNGSIALSHRSFPTEAAAGATGDKGNPSAPMAQASGSPTDSRKTNFPANVRACGPRPESITPGSYAESTPADGSHQGFPEHSRHRGTMPAIRVRPCPAIPVRRRPAPRHRFTMPTVRFCRYPTFAGRNSPCIPRHRPTRPAGSLRPAADRYVPAARTTPIRRRPANAPSRKRPGISDDETTPVMINSPETNTFRMQRPDPLPAGRKVRSRTSRPSRRQNPFFLPGRGRQFRLFVKTNPPRYRSFSRFTRSKSAR